MLERTDAITNEFLEPITFVLAYTTVVSFDKLFLPEVCYPPEVWSRSPSLSLSFVLVATSVRHMSAWSCSDELLDVSSASILVRVEVAVRFYNCSIHCFTTVMRLPLNSAV